MEQVKVILPGNIAHAHQVAVGFIRLAQAGWNVTMQDRSRDRSHLLHGLPVVLAQYRGKKLVYDLWDGYQNPVDMKKALDGCDFYFKRSYSQRENHRLFPDQEEKIFPLGLNFYVTLPECPLQEPRYKRLLKPLFGRAPDVYFTPEVFAGEANRTEPGQEKILFLTQLWPEEATYGEDVGDINRMRMEVIRTLKDTYGDRFVGGLNDTALSRQMAPELIVPKAMTERRAYIETMKGCDICVATAGLFGSIGFKAAEYVAAARAVVHETMVYTVPGDFAPEKNYLPFATAQECVEQVARLVEDPERLYRMKQANQAYYQAYGTPEAIVANSLALVRAREEAPAPV